MSSASAAEGRRITTVSEGIHTIATTTEPYDVCAYMSGSIDHSALPRSVAIGVSSLGNFFMNEIAHMIEDGFRKLGVEPRLFAEHEAWSAAGCEAVLVVAPHEFFLLGDGPIAFQVLRRAPILVMFNTEQQQTEWFALAEQYFCRASAILDINYQTARYLGRSGYRAFALPLGYSDYIDRTFGGHKLPEHDIFKHMPALTRNSLPAAYAERPIDILFIGTSSARRQDFFARNASYFATKNTFIYLPDGTSPFLSTELRTIDFSAFVSIVKRSKVLLNVHRDEAPFLEWQRIVTLGILQRTLVITDHCEPGPFIEPNVDYLDGPLATLPELCEGALRNPQEAEYIAHRAYTKLRTQYPMEQILGKCWTALAKTLS